MYKIILPGDKIGTLGSPDCRCSDLDIKQQVSAIGTTSMDFRHLITVGFSNSLDFRCMFFQNLSEIGTYV